MDNMDKNKTEKDCRLEITADSDRKMLLRQCLKTMCH